MTTAWRSTLPHFLKTLAPASHDGPAPASVGRAPLHVACAVPSPGKDSTGSASDFLLPAPQQIGRDTRLERPGRSDARSLQRLRSLALELPCKRSSHLPHVDPSWVSISSFSRCPLFQGKIKACWFRVRGAKMCHRACQKRIHYDTIPNHSLLPSEAFNRSPGQRMLEARAPFLLNTRQPFRC